MSAVICIGLTICAFLMTPFASAQNLPESVPKPVFKIGDRWVREHIEQWTNEVEWKAEIIVTAVEDDRLRVRQTFLENKNPALVGRSRGGNTTDGVLDSFQFPLSIGKSWKSDRELDTPVGRTRYVIPVTVVGWERQRVGQQEYDALKLEGRGNWFRSPDGSGLVLIDYWYAPELRAVTRIDYRSYTPQGSIYWRWSQVLLSAKVSNLQSAPDHIQNEVENRLSGSWLVTVGSEPKTRTLRVRSVTVASDNTFLAEAQYGYTCGKFNAVLVEGVFSDGQLSLDFLTTSNSHISAKESQVARLSGSFVTSSKRQEAVSLVKYDPAGRNTGCDSAPTPTK